MKKDKNFYHDLYEYFKGLEFEKRYIKITVYIDIIIHNQKYVNINQGGITLLLKEWCISNDIFYADTSNLKSFKLFKKK